MQNRKYKTKIRTERSKNKISKLINIFETKPDNKKKIKDDQTIENLQINNRLNDLQISSSPKKRKLDYMNINENLTRPFVNITNKINGGNNNSKIIDNQEKEQEDSEFTNDDNDSIDSELDELGTILSINEAIWEEIDFYYCSFSN